jgi:hypothetical protein
MTTYAHRRSTARGAPCTHYDGAPEHGHDCALEKKI